MSPELKSVASLTEPLRRPEQILKKKKKKEEGEGEEEEEEEGGNA